MLNWVCMGFLISLDLWYNLIFACRIDPVFYIILLCQTKVFLFLQDSVTYTILFFLFLCRIEQVKPFCSPLFLSTIQWFIPNCSARQNIFFLQNQVIYTNLLIWTKAFLFLWDPVIYTIQLCEITAFLFLQDPVTCTTLLYQTKLFFFMAGSICA